MQRFAIRGMILLSLFALLTAMLAVGCASGQRPGASGRVDADYARISGDWEEEWPNRTPNDIYRAAVASGSNAFYLVPVTNVDMQKISNLNWNGSTLTFDNTFNSRVLRYRLVMQANGSQLAGSVTLPEGNVINVKWVRRNTQATSSTTLTPGYNAGLNEWMGTWEEDWPSSPTHDRYGVELAPNALSLKVSPLTNQHKQQLRNLRFAGNVLTFTLQYNEAVWEYRLVPRSPNLLQGQVSQLGNNAPKTVSWRRISTSVQRIAPQQPSMALQGNWQEQWPNAPESDSYQINVSGQSVQISPLTRRERQSIIEQSANGNQLSLTLKFDDKVWYYSLTLAADGNSLIGEVVGSDTSVPKKITWLRMGQAVQNYTPPAPQPVTPAPVTPPPVVAPPQQQAVVAPPPLNPPVQSQQAVAPQAHVPAPPPIPVSPVRPNVGRIYLVAVGISRYANNTIEPLRYADCDARDFAKQMQSLPQNAVHPQHVKLLLNEQATLNNVKQALTVFLREAIAEDVVYIYFSGHGSPEPENPDNMYFLTHDSDPANMAVTALPMWDIETFLQRYIKAERVVVIADTCHSGGIGPTLARRGGGIGEGDGSAINRYFHSLATSGTGRTIFTASEPNEVSFEDPSWGGGHGVFTHFLLQGMKGAADLDRDGIVTLGELADYVDAEVRRATNSRQHPFLSGEINRNLPVTVTNGQ